jgi:hypothetical protein
MELTRLIHNRHRTCTDLPALASVQNLNHHVISSFKSTITITTSHTIHQPACGLTKDKGSRHRRHDDRVIFGLKNPKGACQEWAFWPKPSITHARIAPTRLIGGKVTSPPRDEVLATLLCHGPFCFAAHDRFAVHYVFNGVMN